MGLYIFVHACQAETSARCLAAMVAHVGSVLTANQSFVKGSGFRVHHWQTTANIVSLRRSCHSSA